MTDRLWRVAVDAPLPEPLTYLAPQDKEQAERITRGVSVIVPLGKRQANGIIIGSTTERGSYELKPIISVNPEFPPISEIYMKWLEWLSIYYLHSCGEVMANFFPPLKKESRRQKKRVPLLTSSTELSIPTLTPEQLSCLNQIDIESGFNTHLLFGVTGSGKTEVYLQLLKKVLDKGQRGLVLVPEISLTPQLLRRFSSRFGSRIAVIHSHLTPREKTIEWWSIADGEKQILIGARSALFCPIENLGLIILDEEHESSFKQDEKLKYHARDSAVMLGKLMGCPVILGSATPSLESWANCKNGKFHLHTMKHRVQDRALPDIKVVDLRKEQLFRKSTNCDPNIPFWLSLELYENLAQNLARRKQSALFLNRRGMAQSIICPACGFAANCPNCAVSLTLHAKSHLICHYCDYHENLKELCPQCKESELMSFGLGTELVENTIHKLFPTARLARADRDEIQTRGDLEELIESIENHNVDILIGTQMIAKGLDFENLTLVGLVLADIGFNIPDFRSAEKSFQLITQVSGRSGRHVIPGESPGLVIVQAFNPDHISLEYAKKHDYVGFAEQELVFRKELNYPPLGRLASIRVQSAKPEKLRETLSNLHRRALELKQRFKDFSVIETLGPAESPIARLRGQYRFHMLIKSPSTNILNAFCRKLIGDQKWITPSTRLLVDVDPVNLL